MVVEQSEVDAKMLEDETNRVSLDARYLGRRAAEYLTVDATFIKHMSSLSD